MANPYSPETKSAKAWDEGYEQCRQDSLADAYREAHATPTAPASAQGDEREKAEAIYTARCFDYKSAPIGSRDWTLFFDGWLHGRASISTPAARPAQAMGEIPDGVYDNIRTFCRESYKGGKRIASMKCEVLFLIGGVPTHIEGEWRKPWGTHPRLPIIAALSAPQEASKPPVDASEWNPMFVAAMRTLLSLGYHWAGGEEWELRQEASKVEPVADEDVLFQLLCNFCQASQDTDRGDARWDKAVEAIRRHFASPPYLRPSQQALSDSQCAEIASRVNADLQTPLLSATEIRAILAAACHQGSNGGSEK